MGYLSSIVQEINSKLVLKKLEEWDVNAENLVEQMEEYQQIFPERAKALREMMKAQNLVTAEGHLSLKRTNDYIRLLELKSRALDKRFGLLSDHAHGIAEWAAGLSATSLAWRSVEQSYDLYNKQLQYSLHAVGSLKEATGDAFDAIVGVSYARAAGVAKAYGEDAERMYEIALEHKRWFGEKASIARMANIAALGKMLNGNVGDVWDYIVDRSREFNDTAYDATMQMRKVSDEFDEVNKEADRLGKPAVFKIWRREFFEAVVETLKTEKHMPKNAAIISDVYAKALKKYMMKGVGSKTDAQAILKMFSMLMGNNPYIKQELGKTLVTRIEEEMQSRVGPYSTQKDIQQARLDSIDKILGSALGAKAKVIYESYQETPGDYRLLEALADLYKEVPEGASKMLRDMQKLVTAEGKGGRSTAVQFFVENGMSNVQAIQAANLIVGDDNVIRDIEKSLADMDRLGIKKDKKPGAPQSEFDLVREETTPRGLLGTLEGMFEFVKASPLSKMVGAVGAAILGWKIHRMQLTAFRANVEGVGTELAKTTATVVTEGAGDAVSSVVGGMSGGTPSGGTGRLGKLMSSLGKFATNKKVIGAVAAIGTSALAWKMMSGSNDQQAPEAPPPPQTSIPDPPAAVPATKAEAPTPPPNTTEQTPPETPPPAEPQPPKIVTRPPVEAPPQQSVQRAKREVAKMETKAKKYADGLVEDRIPQAINEAGMMAVRVSYERVRVDYDLPQMKGYSIQTRMSLAAKEPLTDEQREDVQNQLDKAAAAGGPIPDVVYVRLKNGMNAVNYVQSHAGKR